MLLLPYIVTFSIVVEYIISARLLILWLYAQNLGRRKKISAVQEKMSKLFYGSCSCSLSNYSTSPLQLQKFSQIHHKNATLRVRVSLALFPKMFGMVWDKTTTAILRNCYNYHNCQDHHHHGLDYHHLSHNHQDHLGCLLGGLSWLSWFSWS